MEEEDEEPEQLLQQLTERLAGLTDQPGIPQTGDAIAGGFDQLGDYTDRAATSYEQTDLESSDEIEAATRQPDTNPDRPEPAEGDTGPGPIPHPLRGLWLERRVPADSTDPFTSIMDLPHDDAAELAARMGKRIGDGDYVDTRTQVEAWLRAHAAESGSPAADNPLYFKLVNEQGTFPPGKNSVVIRIPADSIPVEHLTLTVEDSFFNYQLMTGDAAVNSPEGLVPQVIPGADAGAVLDFDGAHRDYLTAARSARYIEAQVWSRDDPILTEARTRFQAGIPEDRTITVESQPSDPDPP